MRRRARGDAEITIVKRRQKRNGVDETESGAWKVAFADFTLAMMALFMVLWIVQPKGEGGIPQPESIALTQLDAVFDGGDGIFDGARRIPLEFEPITLVVPPEAYVHLFDRRRYDSAEELQQLAELLRKVALELNAMANLEIEVVPQGLRILIKDDEQRFMFPRGSAVLDPHFRDLLRKLAGVLAKVENKLIVSGHTDATPYRDGSGYDNWNLSGDRALRARSVLVEAGLPSSSILQVAAQADVMPVLPQEPEHGANRRVELLLLTERAEQLYRQLFGESYTQVHYSEAATEYRGVQAPKQR